MSGNLRIVDHNQLADLDQSGDVPITGDTYITLVLLQPLSTADMFAACRTHMPDVIQDQYGRACGTTNVETLNLEPLATAWRKAIKEAAPIAKITFDLTLPPVPKEREEDRQSRVHWETDPPRRGGFCVPSMAVSRLVAALATATRMRAEGEMSFKLAFDSAQCPVETAMERLEKQLDALARCKAAK